MCMYVCMCVEKRVCVYMINICFTLCTVVCMCMCICIHVCAYVCVCVYVCERNYNYVSVLMIC